MGRTNERIGRMQETYVANATTNWLESLERSLAQMKEYQVSVEIPWSDIYTDKNVVCPQEARAATFGLRCIFVKDAKG